MFSSEGVQFDNNRFSHEFHDFDDQQPGMNAQSSRYQALFGAHYVNRMFPLQKYLDMGIDPTVEAAANGEVLGKGLPSRSQAIWTLR